MKRSRNLRWTAYARVKLSREGPLLDHFDRLAREFDAWSPQPYVWELP